MSTILSTETDVKIELRLEEAYLLNSMLLTARLCYPNNLPMEVLAHKITECVKEAEAKLLKI